MRWVYRESLVFDQWIVNSHTMRTRIRGCSRDQQLLKLMPIVNWLLLGQVLIFSFVPSLSSITTLNTVWRIQQLSYADWFTINRKISRLGFRCFLDCSTSDLFRRMYSPSSFFWFTPRAAEFSSLLISPLSRLIFSLSRTSSSSDQYRPLPKILNYHALLTSSSVQSNSTANAFLIDCVHICRQ